VAITGMQVVSLPVSDQDQTDDLDGGVERLRARGLEFPAGVQDAPPEG
jgi:hypothetical protein